MTTEDAERWPHFAELYAAAAKRTSTYWGRGNPRPNNVSDEHGRGAQDA